MIKKILAILKSIALVIGGLIALIGARAICEMVNKLPHPYLKMVAGISLIVGMICVWCKWYLRNEDKKND